MQKYLDLISLRFNYFILLVFIFLAILVFGNALNNPFVLDDKIQIVNNLHIQSLSNISSFFYSSSFFESGNDKMVGIYYKPLMTSYFAVIWHYFGNNPMAYRIPLLLLHIFSSFIIFLFSKKFLPIAYAAILGCIFLIHPINAEVVLYISDAQDIFYFFFGICSLYMITFIENKYKLFLLLSLLFTLAVLSKETGVLFLLFGMFYSFFLSPEKTKPVWSAAFLIGFFYFLIRMKIGLTQTQIPILLFHTTSFFLKLKMLPLILGHYIELFFFPSRLSLTTDFVLSGFPFDLFWQPLMLIVIFFIATFYISKKLFFTKQSLLLKFFLFILFCWFILHGQMIVPLDGIYTDRWFYIGTWGLSSIIALWLLEQKKIPPKILFITSILVLIVFSIRSYVRSVDWQDPLILYTREVRLHPWDALMNNNVGIFLFRQGKIDEAANYFKISTEANPRWPIAWNNLGVAREQQQKYDEALNFYYRSQEAAAFNLGYVNYARMLYRLNEKEKLIHFLKEKALPTFPNNPNLNALWQKARE